MTTKKPGGNTKTEDVTDKMLRDEGLRDRFRQRLLQNPTAVGIGNDEMESRIGFLIMLLHHNSGSVRFVEGTVKSTEGEVKASVDQAVHGGPRKAVPSTDTSPSGSGKGWAPPTEEIAPQRT